MFKHASAWKEMELVKCKDGNKYLRFIITVFHFFFSAVQDLKTDGNDLAALIGGIIGAVVAIALIITAAVLYCKKQHKFCWCKYLCFCLIKILTVAAVNLFPVG